MNLLPAIQAVARAESAGFQVMLDDRGLRLSGPTSVPADLIAALRSQKPAIMALGRFGLLQPGLWAMLMKFQPRSLFIDTCSRRGDEVADLAPVPAISHQQSTINRDSIAWRQIAESVLNGDYRDADRQTLRTLEIGLRWYKDAVSREALTWIRRRLGIPTAEAPQLLGVIEWEEQECTRIRRDDSLRETTKQALINARRGQGLFRSRVATLEHQCRVTGVSRPEHLVAGHIKPWRESSNDERLTEANGLLLTPSIDHLFDRGFISFENHGELLVSPVAHQDSLRRMGVACDHVVHVGEFNQDQQHFLEFHRTQVFLKSFATGA